MAKTNWEKIKQEYITDNGATYKSLSKKYDVSFATLQEKARLEKWKDKRKKLQEKTIEKISETTAEAIAKDYENICEKAREELNALMELNTQIRLGFTAKDQWAEKRVSTCIDNVTKIIAQMEKLRYPEHDKQTQEITVVMPQKLKEFSE